MPIQKFTGWFQYTSHSAGAALIREICAADLLLTIYWIKKLVLLK
jgi:hypothetical protein